MATADLLNQLWEDLAAPSAPKFLKALRSRGIAARESDVRRFVADKSERQILAKVKYTGKVVASSENERWQADIIDFSSRPVIQGGKTYTRVLLVQDSFSRFLYTRPMTSTSETVMKMKEILEIQQPRRIDTDGGSEFTSIMFRQLCKTYDIILITKEKNDINGLARMDKAIGELKKNIKRLQELEGTGGGKWLEYLTKATKAYNQTSNGAIQDATPANIPDNVKLELINEAAVGAEHNQTEIEQRKKTLLKLKAFRTLDKAWVEKGLKKRIDANKWDSKIHVVDSFPREAVVMDTEGNSYKTKRVLPIPITSSATATPRITLQDRLRSYAIKLQAIVRDNPMDLLAAMKLMQRGGGVSTTLREAGQTATHLVKNNPDLFRKIGKKIVAKDPPEESGPEAES